MKLSPWPWLALLLATCVNTAFLGGRGTDHMRAANFILMMLSIAIFTSIRWGERDAKAEPTKRAEALKEGSK
jgi:hypothetical protein